MTNCGSLVLPLEDEPNKEDDPEEAEEDGMDPLPANALRFRSGNGSVSSSLHGSIDCPPGVVVLGSIDDETETNNRDIDSEDDQMVRNLFR